MTTRVLHFQHSDLFTNGEDIPDALYDHFQYRIDGGTPVALTTPVEADHQYDVNFDDSQLPPGTHLIEVSLVLTDGRGTNWVPASFDVVDERVPSDPFAVSVS